MPGTLPASDQLTCDLAGVLGLYVSGDIGDLTSYTTRKGRVVIFPKSPPKKPPSPGQVTQRSRFRTAQAAYMALTPAEKFNWEEATKRLSIDATGQNAYVSLALRPDPTWVELILRRTGINLPNPPFVP